MGTYSKLTPKGTRDILFEECAAQREARRRLSQVFSLRGYHEVLTPGLEFFDVFNLPGAAIPQQEMYKCTDNQGRLLVLRPDSTLPIARMAASRLQQRQKPLRFYYGQTVYRNSPDLSGRNDECAQMGIELMGAQGLRADLEVIAAGVEALSTCVENFRVEIGHAGFFRALADQLPLSQGEREQLRTTIESKNYAALSELLDPLEPTPAVEAMRRLPRLFGGQEVLAQAERWCEGDAAQMLEYLQTLYSALGQLGLGDRLMVDLGLVQRNDYYTGMVFSAYVEDQGDAVLLGGRYDKLCEKFGAPMPAVGFSIDLDAVASLLGEGAPAPQGAEVLVFGEEGREVQALEQVAALTRAGTRCESALCSTLEEALAYAREAGIPKVLRLGEALREIPVTREEEQP